LENYLQNVNRHGSLRYAEDFLLFLIPPKQSEDSVKESVPSSIIAKRGHLDSETTEEERE